MDLIKSGSFLRHSSSVINLQGALLARVKRWEQAVVGGDPFSPLLWGTESRTSKGVVLSPRLSQAVCVVLCTLIL